MRVYIAAVFEERYRLRPFAKRLKRMGYRVLSDWLSDRIDSLDTEDIRDNAIGDSDRDISNVIKSDILILDTIVNNARGGKYVEEGGVITINYLLNNGYVIHTKTTPRKSVRRKQFWIVGPNTNVFTYKADRQFRSWDECLEFMSKLIDCKQKV